MSSDPEQNQKTIDPQQRLVDTIHRVLQKHTTKDLELEGNLVVGWVVGVDLLEPDGQRKLITFNSDSMPAWMKLGMLETIQQNIIYHTIESTEWDEDEDEDDGED